MTLEQFRQTMQDDNFRSNRNRAPELGGFITLEQFLLRQEEERQRANNKQQERTGISNEFANFDSSGREQEEFHNAEAINRFRGELQTCAENDFRSIAFK